MKQELNDLVLYRLEKAKKTLSDARLYISNGSLESTTNRIYYAMFYAVNALIISKGFSSSKHSGVRAILNNEFVNKGIIKKELGKFNSDMFDSRQEGDYKDFVQFEEKDFKEWLEKAEEFINKIEETTVKIISNKNGNPCE